MKCTVSLALVSETSVSQPKYINFHEKLYLFLRMFTTRRLAVSRQSRFLNIHSEPCPPEPYLPHVVVVGGGTAGTSVSAQLLRKGLQRFVQLS